MKLIICLKLSVVYGISSREQAQNNSDETGEEQWEHIE